MFYNKEIETMERSALQQLQSERLIKIIQYTYNRVPFYRERMDAWGVRPEDIHSIEDISKLPFMQKENFRDNYPYGTFAVPMKEIVRLHASSGTTGKPIVVGYTQYDLNTWSECMARCLTAYGATADDVIQVAYSYGMFTGGLGIHYGVERIGATVLPTSSGNNDKQILCMKDLNVTGLCCAPSYALHLAEIMENTSQPTFISDLKLRFGVFGAEPWTEQMRHELEKKLCIKAYDIYGLTEIYGPGVGGECVHQCGSHIWEDYFLPEIIDPITLKPLAPGEVGELVLTTLTKEGMPMIRFRTRDLTSLNYEPCECGRTMVRMGRIVGRTDDMIILNGANVFPTQIEEILMETPEFAGQYLITIDRVNNIDILMIDVELRIKNYTDAIGKILQLKNILTNRLSDALGVTPKLRVLEPNSLKRSEGKAYHVIDKRSLY